MQIAIKTFLGKPSSRSRAFIFLIALSTVCATFVFKNKLIASAGDLAFRKADSYKSHALSCCNENTPGVNQCTKYMERSAFLYRITLSLKPRDRIALMNYIALLGMYRDHAFILREIDRLSDKSGHSPDFLYAKYRLHIYYHDRARAISTLEELTTSYGKYADAHYLFCDLAVLYGLTHSKKLSPEIRKKCSIEWSIFKIDKYSRFSDLPNDALYELLYLWMLGTDSYNKARYNPNRTKPVCIAD